MEIAIFILGIILGGLISWWISHVYYVKANQEQQTLFNKLNDDVRATILQDKRSSLSIRELNEILEKKTIKSPINGDPLPYKACPKCGSENLKRKELVGNDNLYYVIECIDCQWNDWTQ